MSIDSLKIVSPFSRDSFIGRCGKSLFSQNAKHDPIGRALEVVRVSGNRHDQGEALVATGFAKIISDRASNLSLATAVSMGPMFDKFPRLTRTIAYSRGALEDMLQTVGAGIPGIRQQKFAAPAINLYTLGSPFEHETFGPSYINAIMAVESGGYLRLNLLTRAGKPSKFLPPHKGNINLDLTGNEILQDTFSEFGAQVLLSVVSKMVHTACFTGPSSIFLPEYINGVKAAQTQCMNLINWVTN